MRVVLSFLTIVSAAFVVLSLILFYHHVVGKSSEAKHEIRVSIFFSFLTALCLLLSGLTQFKSVYDAQHFQHSTYSSLEGEFVDLTPGEGYAGMVIYLFGIAFHTVSMLVIVVNWFKTLSKLDENFPAQVMVSTQNLKRGIVIVTVVFLILLLILSVMLFLYEALFLAVIDSSFLGVAFVFGFLRFRQKMDKYEIRAKRFRVILDQVKETSAGMVVFTSLYVVLQCFFCFLIVDYLNHLEVGRFNYIQLLKDLSTLCIFMVQAYMLHYSYFVTKALAGVTSKRHKKSSLHSNRFSSNTFKKVSEVDNSRTCSE